MNKMTLYEFLRLSEVEQYNTVWSLGVHVDTHIKDNIAITCIQLMTFTVRCITILRLIKYSTNRF